MEREGEIVEERCEEREEEREVEREEEREDGRRCRESWGLSSLPVPVLL